MKAVRLLHIVPVCGWVKERFFSDPRYRLLQGFYQPSDRVVNGRTDGAEMTLYIWREFCENPNPPPISGPPIDEVVERLKALLRATI